MISLRPFVSNLSAYCAMKACKDREKNNFPDGSTVQRELFFRDSEALLTTSRNYASQAESLQNRMAIYALQAEHFSDEDDLETKETKFLRQTAVLRFREIFTDHQDGASNYRNCYWI